MSVMKGIYRIEVPTPFKVGSVNTYLIQGETISLIDTGPQTQNAIDTLRRKLEEIGYQIKDIDEVIITHGHLDHYGMSNLIEEESGASVYMHKEDASIVSALHSKNIEVFSSLKRSMSLSGVPEGIISRIMALFKSHENFGKLAKKINYVNEGEVLDFGEYMLKVIHSPGHSPGSICLLEEGRRILFSGDTLIEDISPNPIYNFLDKEKQLGSRGLIKYLQSIDKIKKYDVKLVLPGHRNIIKDYKKRINDIIKHHEEKKLSILSKLSREPKTAFEISRIVYEDLSLSELFLGIAEVVGHLEILEQEGKVESFKVNEVIYYKKL